MLKLDDFKKLTKSHVLNTRYVRGGENANQTLYYPSSGVIHDDYAHTLDNGHDSVQRSGHVPGGGTAQADPLP